jgi:hypothetical protein
MIPARRSTRHFRTETASTGGGRTDGAGGQGGIDSRFPLWDKPPFSLTRVLEKLPEHAHLSHHSHPTDDAAHSHLGPTRIAPAGWPLSPPLSCLVPRESSGREGASMLGFEEGLVNGHGNPPEAFRCAHLRPPAWLPPDRAKYFDGLVPRRVFWTAGWPSTIPMEQPLHRNPAEPGDAIERLHPRTVAASLPVVHDVAMLDTDPLSESALRQAEATAHGPNLLGQAVAASSHRGLHSPRSASRACPHRRNSAAYRTFGDLVNGWG